MSGPLNALTDAILFISYYIITPINKMDMRHYPSLSVIGYCVHAVLLNHLICLRLAFQGFNVQGHFGVFYFIGVATMQ